MNAKIRPEQPPRIAIIDNDEDGRFLLEKTLSRKFPGSVIRQCRDAEDATEEIQKGLIDLVIAHRTFDLDGASLVKLLRGKSATVPIIMMSGYDRQRVAKEAGASRFLNYDAWLQIGPLVEDVLRNPAPSFSATVNEENDTQKLDA